MSRSSLLRWVQFALICMVVVATAACERKSAQVAPGSAYQAISRTDFNRRAVELNLPLFWREDANANRILEPQELALLMGHPQSYHTIWFDANGGFTAQFRTDYRLMTEADKPLTDPAEQKRHQLVLEELAQGRVTLVETDLSAATPAEVQFIVEMLNVARLIERIYARQKGVFGMEADTPTSDAAGRALFRRNQSPYCEAPKTEKEAACGALAVMPPRVSGLYPASIQSEPGFCERLAKLPNAAALMNHFAVVVEGDQAGAFKSTPYNEAYAQDMTSVATELEAAARGWGDDEAALRTYLNAAAAAFRSNDWEPANAAWVAMNAQNSKWYVRVAPDEVYFEPCAWKAGFALQVARINPQSIEWQNKLDPLKRDMENALAALAGAPYKVRDVQFRIPDFIDVVMNAGEQRAAHGATIGQSLPNWGKVAEQGGRTVAMTNLYTDADSREQQQSQMSSLFCKATSSRITTTPRETLISSVLHEAAHNLGPSHDYKVRGSVDDAIFGGTLASTLEELKAQTSAMYLTSWLSEKGIFTADEVSKIQLRNISWMFGHISRGMYAADGTPRNYSQLAAMQLGAFMDSKVIAWRADELAANGTDKGCIEIDFSALPAAVTSLETAVLTIKASGDKARAEQLKAKYVDAKDEFDTVKSVIAERTLRAPKASFVYSIKLP